MYSLSDSDDLSDTIIEEDGTSNDNKEFDSDSTIISNSAITSIHKNVAQTFEYHLPVTSKIADSELLQSSSIKDIRDANQYVPDLELDSILRKYSDNLQTVNNHNTSTNKLVECIELSSDEESSVIPAKNYMSSPLFVPNSEHNDVDILMTEPSLNNDSSPSSSKKKNNLLDDGTLFSEADAIKSCRRMPKISPTEKERKKVERATDRIKKKEQAERAKLVKQAFASANKNLKPEECMKFITVLLDVRIANEEYAAEVLNVLQSASIAYSLQPQLVPRTITWSRIVQNQAIDDVGVLQQISETHEVGHALILLDWKEVIDLVYKKQLCEHIKSLQTILVDKKLVLGIYGLHSYFSYQKSQKQKNLRNEITQYVQVSTIKYNKKFKDVPEISRDDLEFALSELQILCSCCHRLLETKLDVGNLIACLTKAVAQAPYKLELYKKQQEVDHYIWEDNKNVVQVDKDGTGLQRLWQQQLMTFALARIEHAESITAKFPTLHSLMEEYSKCSEKDGEKLLQDIPVRRAAGPLTTVRKIGPELSKKIYKVLTSLDGSAVF